MHSFPSPPRRPKTLNLRRLLLPYERHIKGEQDKPLPLAKPRKQEGGQDKASGAKAKTAGTKKLKGSNSQKQESKKERAETAKGQEPPQVSQLLLDPPTFEIQIQFDLLIAFSLLPMCHLEEKCFFLTCVRNNVQNAHVQSVTILHCLQLAHFSARLPSFGATFTSFLFI